ncbi:nuclear transport factor 2-like isoform X2 [Quercus robur]|uniref:nuclear transport factor 2-like isoform X2 n=1 Tax=Quercus robur TaxID=38942 RepID=UPI002161DE33|nr:nuclear transport factor 2-like isoform X2 [Quercus robur]
MKKKSVKRQMPKHRNINAIQTAKTYAIFVPNLLMNAIVEQLEAVFNNFGPIKHNGIQVRSSKGTCFGFVEFESASSMRSAIKLTMTEGGFQDMLVIEMKTLGAVETSVVEILA